MKYIRTRGKIYNVSDLHESQELNGNVLVDKKGWCIYPEDIIKQADTVEELCDEFVYKDDLYNKLIGKIKGYDGKDYIRLESEYDVNINVGLKNWEKIKGAIWTEWGLKYVAMMNEKGELDCL